MGLLVFSPCNGVVEVPRKCDDKVDAASVLTIEIDGTPINKVALVSGMTLEMSGNYQFLHTLDEFVYFYAFGDRVGVLTLTGLGFLVQCKGSKGGILDIYDYYMQRRSAKSGNKAMSIVLSAKGKTIKLWGFLTGMRVDVNDGQMGTVGYWSLRFDVLPQK